MPAHEGGCLCGQIRCAAKAQPVRLTYCYCRFCQRATGSAYLVEPIFLKSDFAVTAGTPSIYRHRSEGSGKMVDVHFCATCGTKLFLSFERFPTVVGLYAGTFDDPNWFDRPAAHAKHIFLGVAQKGTVIPAGVACFREHAMTNAGEPIAPTIYDEPRVIGAD